MSTISGAERPAITVSDLVFHWPDGTPVLGDEEAGFNLVVPPGRSGLVGANGSGKSTLMAILAGSRHPHSGVVATTLSSPTAAPSWSSATTPASFPISASPG